MAPYDYQERFREREVGTPLEGVSGEPGDVVLVRFVDLFRRLVEDMAGYVALVKFGPSEIRE
jgi:hypothetical protein